MIMKLCCLLLYTQVTVGTFHGVMSNEESLMEECPFGRDNDDSVCQGPRNVNVKYHKANILPVDGLESISPFKLDMVNSISLPVTPQSVDLYTRSTNVGVSFKGYVDFPSDHSITKICLMSNGKTNVFIDSFETPAIKKSNRYTPSKGKNKSNKNTKSSKNKKGSKSHNKDSYDEQLCTDIDLSGVHEISVDFLKKGGLGHAKLNLMWGNSYTQSMEPIPVDSWVPRPLDVDQYHRFEKFNLTAGIDLPDIEFPLDESSARFLRDNSNSISVYLPAQCTGVNLDTSKEELFKKDLYPPTQPEKDAFWKYFKEVLDLQIIRKENDQQLMSADPLKSFMPFSSLPDLWKENEAFNIYDVAKAVKDEFPGIYHGQLIAKWLDKKSVKPNSIIPKFGKIEFVRGPVFLSDMVGHAISLVGPCNFVMKWEVGRPRPEEIARKVKKNEISVPIEYKEDIVAKIEKMDELDESATRFTAYSEGSPTHPSWPAMHSASSAASFWLDVVLDLTEEQLCEARKLDYSIAQARSVAGVHYEDDNMSGLIFGQSILTQRLPDVFATLYGANKAKVTSRCEAKRYDWTKFRNTRCYLGKGTGFEIVSNEHVSTE